MTARQDEGFAVARAGGACARCCFGLCREARDHGAATPAVLRAASSRSQPRAFSRARHARRGAERPRLDASTQWYALPCRGRARGAPAWNRPTAIGGGKCFGFRGGPARCRSSPRRRAARCSAPSAARDAERSANRRARLRSTCAPAAAPHAGGSRTRSSSTPAPTTGDSGPVRRRVAAPSTLVGTKTPRRRRLTLGAVQSLPLDEMALSALDRRRGAGPGLQPRRPPRSGAAGAAAQKRPRARPTVYAGAGRRARVRARESE